MSFNNNLIRNQLVGQLELLRSMSADQLTKVDRVAIADLPKRIAAIEKGMIAEKAAAEQKAHHEETVARHKEAKAMKKAGRRAEPESNSHYSDKEIPCRDCGEGFVFTARKQEVFAEKGLSEPVRCAYCNEYRKQFQHRKLPCVECATEFDFPIGAQIHYVEQGYEDPTLCHPCRAAKKKVIPPEVIRCKECDKDFKFGHGEQMFFKEHGWQEPRRCIPCRKIHKAEWAEKQAARVAAKAMKAKVAPVAPDLGKFAEGADPNMKFGPPPSSPLGSGGIDPAELIAAASAMVNGDGTFKGAIDVPEEGWQTVGK
jgi:hypothetical protein